MFLILTAIISRKNELSIKYESADCCVGLHQLATSVWVCINISSSYHCDVRVNSLEWKEKEKYFSLLGAVAISWFDWLEVEIHYWDFLESPSCFFFFFKDKNQNFKFLSTSLIITQTGLKQLTRWVKFLHSFYSTCLNKSGQPWRKRKFASE